MFGQIYIENGCKIGANAVVNKSCYHKNCILEIIQLSLKVLEIIDLDIYIVGEKLILRVRFRCFINLF